METATRRVNIHGAKTHLSELIQEAARGDEIIIANAGKPVARLLAVDRLPEQLVGRAISWRGTPGQISLIYATR